MGRNHWTKDPSDDVSVAAGLLGLEHPVWFCHCFLLIFRAFCCIWHASTASTCVGYAIKVVQKCSGGCARMPERSGRQENLLTCKVSERILISISFWHWKSSNEASMLEKVSTWTQWKLHWPCCKPVLHPPSGLKILWNGGNLRALKGPPVSPPPPVASQWDSQEKLKPLIAMMLCRSACRSRPWCLRVFLPCKARDLRRHVNIPCWMRDCFALPHSSMHHCALAANPNINPHIQCLQELQREKSKRPDGSPEPLYSGSSSI